MCTEKKKLLPFISSSHTGLVYFCQSKIHPEDALAPILYLVQTVYLQCGPDIVPGYKLMSISECSEPQVPSSLFAALRWSHLSSDSTIEVVPCNYSVSELDPLQMGSMQH